MSNGKERKISDLDRARAQRGKPAPFVGLEHHNGHALPMAQKPFPPPELEPDPFGIAQPKDYVEEREEKFQIVEGPIKADLWWAGSWLMVLSAGLVIGTGIYIYRNGIPIFWPW